MLACMCVCVYVSTTCDRKYKRILVLIFILVRSSFTYFVFNKEIRFSVYQKVYELLFVYREDDQQDSHFERVNVCLKKKKESSKFVTEHSFLWVTM